eukprot:TRINITY_DN25068_c0_g1_i1.p2 TRINITY_DN25068_c0_g1~~TRINITY_DN25068_c0_g1_i1.p2  ORF type:complete len:118 (-),score=1.62 TRINITY_DN25068_c0_g1_i1:150-503(-)
MQQIISQVEQFMVQIQIMECNTVLNVITLAVVVRPTAEIHRRVVPAAWIKQEQYLRKHSQLTQEAIAFARWQILLSLDGIVAWQDQQQLSSAVPIMDFVTMHRECACFNVHGTHSNI